MNQKSPQKSVCDWGDMMNEEDDWADSGGDTKQQLPRRDSWASEMIKEDDSKHQTIIVPSSRPRRIEEERSQPIQASTATSVIRLNPCDMPRVRKESEKYNASDNESYGQSREPVIYGGNPRGGNSRGRGRGRGRGGRGAHHNYDPDYDRNVPYRPKSEVTPRSREDRFSRNSERSDGGDHGPSRQMTKNEHLMRDLKQKIKELGWSYEKVNGSTGVEFSPIKKRVLDLYREIVLNDPELTFQEKVDNNVCTPSMESRRKIVIFSFGLACFTKRLSSSVGCKPTQPKVMLPHFAPNTSTRFIPLLITTKTSYSALKIFTTSI